MLTKEQRAEIAETVTKLERDLYGRGPSSVRVWNSGGSPEVVTVLSMDTLTVSDQTLVERGAVNAVAARHDSLHMATYDDFWHAVADVVGEEPNAYFGQVDPHTGYAVRVFVFES